MGVLRALIPRAGGFEEGEALPARSAARVAAVQLAILLVLWVAAFRSELASLGAALEDANAAHALAGPLIILAILWWRREALAEGLARGSLWGVVLLAGALAVFVLSSWPFNYAYPRRAASVLAVAGPILAVGGWRVLKLCLPILLVLLVAVPTGSRYYAFLIIKPETYTLSAVQATLDLLPGVFVDLRGPDLYYFGSHGSGTIALGEQFRGAAMLLAYLTIGLLVAFARRRPWWQLLVFGALAPAVVLFCNYARLVFWGLITIYVGAHALSPMPRLVSSALALVLAYGLRRRDRRCAQGDARAAGAGDRGSP